MSRSSDLSLATSLCGIALTKGAGTSTFRLWPMVNGLWRESVQIKVEDGVTPEDLAEKLQTSVANFLAETGDAAGDAAYHLAILVRWYHSSWRDGHWYPMRSGTKPSVRRISRAALRLLEENPRD